MLTNIIFNPQIRHTVQHYSSAVQTTKLTQSVKAQGFAFQVLLCYIVSCRVLFNQLYQAYNSVKRDQLNEVLFFTLQILFGVLNKRWESINKITDKT